MLDQPRVDPLELEKHLGAVHDGDLEAPFLKLVRQLLTVQKTQGLLVVEDGLGPVGPPARLRCACHVDEKEMRVQLRVEVSGSRMIERSADQFAVNNLPMAAAKGVVLLHLPHHSPDRSVVGLLDPLNTQHVGYRDRLRVGQGAIVPGPTRLHLLARLLVPGEPRGDQQFAGRRMPPLAHCPEPLLPHGTG